MKELCNRFLTAKPRKVEAGGITTPMFQDYKTTADLMVS